MSTMLLDRATLRLNGQTLAAGWVDLDEAVTSIRMRETITGASTVDVTAVDAHRVLLRAPQLRTAASLVLDGAGFTLVKVGKQGSAITLAFEDVAVAALRRHTKPRKVGAGQMSRVDFCRALIREEPWIKVEAAAQSPRSLVELARGSTGEPTAGDKPEDTWDAVSRIMGEIGWRVFARRGVVHLTPDSALAKQTPYRLRENTGGVDEIGLDWDTGKPAATASFTCRAGFADLPAGSAVQLDGMGPGDGVWIVETVTRTPDSTTAQVKLLRPQPTLPEPTGTTGNEGEKGYTLAQLTGGSTGTPTTGTVEKVVQTALAQQGKPYVWGDEGPNSFDCSGLVQWAAAKQGISLPRTSGDQYKALAKRGQTVPVSQAIATRGALLFKGPNGSQHVAISLGNGKTIEAMGRDYGVVIGNANGRGWSGGAVL